MRRVIGVVVGLAFLAMVVAVGWWALKTPENEAPAKRPREVTLPEQLPQETVEPSPETAVLEEEGEASSPPDMALVSGQVTCYPEEAPMPAVRVTQEGGSLARPRETTTAEDGTYLLADLPAGKCLVKFYCPPGFTIVGRVNCAVGEHDIELRAGEAHTVNALMVRETSISGRVMDRAGSGIAGAEVVCRCGSEISVAGTTGDDGGYALGGVTPEGGYTLTASAAGYCSWSRGVERVPFEGATGIDLVLEREATIRGHVLDTRDRLLAGVEVCFRNVDWIASTRALYQGEDAYPYPWLTSPPTDERGQFELGGLATGVYTPLVRMPDKGSYLHGSLNDPITLAAGQQMDGLRVVIAAFEDNVIEGHAWDKDGEGVPGVEVSAAISGSVVDATETDAEGAYRIEGIDYDFQEPNVLLRIRFRHPDFLTTYLEGVSPQTMDADVVLMRPGNISGEVLEARGNRPLQTFEVEVTEISPGEEEELYSRSGRLTKQPGAFTIEGVAASLVTLQVSAPAHEPVTRQIAVEEGETVEARFVLRPQCLLTGTATWNGEPQTSRLAAVEAVSLDGQHNSDGWWHVEKDGTYSITSLVEGEYLVRAFCRRREPPTWYAERFARARVVPGRITQLDFEMAGSGCLRGMVQMPEGCEAHVDVQGSRDAPLVPWGEHPGFQHELVGRARCAEPDGAYEIPGIPPGTYKVTAMVALKDEAGELADIQKESRTVTIADGEDALQDFAF